MATVGTPRNFVVQQIFEFLLQNTTDKSIIGYLKHCKTSTLENTVEMVYPSGKFWLPELSEMTLNKWLWIAGKSYKVGISAAKTFY